MNKGFTLIELLVVVLIIGILSAVALPQYATAVEKSRAVEALSLMKAAADSAERYRLQKDAWPGEDEFNKLDTEIPLIDANRHGGKSFEIHMAPYGGGDKFVVVAERLLDNSGKYVLKTILEDNADGTISSSRFCTTDTTLDDSGKDESFDPDDQAGKFCAAVTNGNINNF